MDMFRKLCSCSVVKETRDEREEMDLSEVLKVFHSAINEVSSLKSRHEISQDEIESCKLELIFLRTFFWSIFTLDYNQDEEISRILIRVNQGLEAIRGISINRLASPSGLEEGKLEAETWFLDVQDRIQHCKKECELSCDRLLRCSLRCNSFKCELTLDFLDAFLKDLYMFKTEDEICLLENQITTLRKMLRLLHIFFDLTPEEWNGFKEMREFKVAVHPLAHYSAILVFSCWVTTVDERRAAYLGSWFRDVLDKIKHCVPVFKAFYIRFLQEMKLSQLDPPLLGEIIQILLDLLFDSLYTFAKNLLINFQHSIMFLISFLTNPPHQHGKDKEIMTITIEIEVLRNEYLDLLLLVDNRKRGTFRAISDFERKIELVKGKIQQVYDPIRDTFSYDFPKIDGLGYFNFLIQNIGFLKEKWERDATFIPFAKHAIIKIEKELMYIRPYLIDLFERQKVHKELKDTWFEVINLAYQTEYALNSCLVLGNQLWYDMTRLMEALDKVKAVKIKLTKIEGRETQEGGGLHCSTIALNKVPEDPRALGSDALMVGLENEVDRIVEYLVKGSKILTLVAIVGMAGIGKTTVSVEEDD